MVYVNNDSSQSFLSVNKYDDDIPKDHISRLIKKKWLKMILNIWMMRMKKVVDVLLIVKQAY